MSNLENKIKKLTLKKGSINVGDKFQPVDEKIVVKKEKQLQNKDVDVDQDVVDQDVDTKENVALVHMDEDTIFIEIDNANMYSARPKLSSSGYSIHKRIQLPDYGEFIISYQNEHLRLGFSVDNSYISYSKGFNVESFINVIRLIISWNYNTDYNHTNNRALHKLLLNKFCNNNKILNENDVHFINVNFLNSKKNSYLHFAARQNNIPVLMELIKEDGINMLLCNQYGLGAVHIAAAYRNFKALICLLQGLKEKCNSQFPADIQTTTGRSVLDLAIHAWCQQDKWNIRSISEKMSIIDKFKEIIKYSAKSLSDIFEIDSLEIVNHSRYLKDLDQEIIF